MKKALFFVLGAALMAMLPGSAKAQSKTIELGVRTLDHAVLDSAWIFAGADSADYFVDSTHLSGTHPTVVCTDTAVASMALTVTADGFGITGSADSTIYAKGAIVARDVNGRIYVYSASTQAERTDGIIKVRSLFTEADSLVATLTVAGNVLMPYDFAVSDNHGWSYSTLAAAIADPQADTINFVATTVNVDNTINIGRSVVVNQLGKAFVSQTSTAFTTSPSAILTWNGGNGTITSTANPSYIFNVQQASGLVLQNVVATATNVVTLDGIFAIASVNNSTLNVAEGGLYAIIAKSQSALQVDSVNFAGGNSGISLSADFAGTAQVLGSTVLNRMSGYEVPVNANAYIIDGSYRNYYRTLQRASDAATLGAIVRLAQNVATDTIEKGITLMMEGDSVGDLYLRHTAGGVVMMNGTVNVLSTDADNISGITIDSIDVMTNFLVNSHMTQINNGRYNNIDIANATPQTLNISGGKFNGNPRATLRQFLNPGKAFNVNDEADAARFPWKVVDGYTVSWNNWDYKGHDTALVYNNADRHISPVFSRPGTTSYKDGVDLDTLFIGWYIEPEFIHPWNFPTDELTSDTTLYAKYMVVDCNVTSEYTVAHLRQNLARTGYDTANVFTYRDTTGEDITLYSVLYYGYEVVGSADTTIAGTDWNAQDTFYFKYDRIKVPVVWAAGQGYVDGNYPNHFTNDTMYFGDTIDYTLHNATREGYTFTGWDTTHITVFYDVDTIWALYIQNTYPVTWKVDGTNIDTTVYSTAYTGSAFAGLSGVYTDDNSTEVEANLTFIKGNDTVRTPDYPVNAGTWTVYAAPVNPAYMLSNNIFTLTITPAELTISGVEVDTVKFYDGNRLARVANSGVISGFVGSDSAEPVVIAMYDNAEVGEGKTIVATYSLGSAIGTNYRFANNSDTLSRNGVILEAIVPDNTYGDSNTGILVDATGYCTGNGIINYQLTSGNPDQYKLSFSDSIFTDTNWNTIATAGQIVIDVPAGTEPGTYNVTIVFGDSRYPQLVSSPVTVSFNVNLPETYTMPLFSDVIALVDTCHCFTDIHWFHSTDGGATWTEVVEAQGKYYYQEVGGLTGQYRAMASMNGLTVMTCPQTDVTTLIEDAPAPAATVDAYPNPATDQVTLRVNGSAARTHTLRVMSVMGLTIENRVFEGNETKVNMRGLQAGNYVVSVDGIVVRVIKK